ncbi:MAG: hypothetical protein BWX64_01323 [Acidobacteria bacterium ADurb.Bin051]|nr:MAG: hypothetical protein BWX64_01323 [Acidobacteria bacterium ADurb.Bin051]
MAAAEAADAEAGRERTWAARAGEVLGGEVPEPWPEVAEVLAGWRRLGRDANGSTLYGERLALLGERGVDDPGQREAWQALFDAADDVLARLRAAELEALRERAEV